jgi:hypothetical protein
MLDPEIPASGHFWQVALLLGRPNLNEPTSSGPLAPGPASLASQFFAAESAALKCGIQRGLRWTAHMLGVETSDNDVESGEDRCMENQRVVRLIPWKGARKLIVRIF